MNWEAEIYFQRGALTLDCHIESAGAPILALIGPNGGGKSTLLQLLVGSLKAQRIKFSVGHETLADSSGAIFFSPQERRLGYLPQGYALFPHLNGLQNVAFGLSCGLHRISSKIRKARVMEVLSALNAAHLAPRRVASMSGGERQRIALARAMVIRPRMLLLDEAFSALDAQTRRQVRSFLAEQLSCSSYPTLIVTHDLRDLMALPCTICVLEEGRIVQRGTLAELQKNPASPFVEEFLAPLGLAGPA